MDGDVSRSEENRQSHCACLHEECPYRKEIMLNGMVRCEECSRTCILHCPCEGHSQEAPDRYAEHLTSLIREYISDGPMIPFVITIPCDSMDTWIVAACEAEEMKYELITNPWESIIAKKAYYQGTRIKNRKKTKNVFDALGKMMIQNWDTVLTRCTQARKFQDDMFRVWGRRDTIRENNASVHKLY